MVSSDGSVVIVFNGEIYNYRELKKELVSKGYAFRSHADTEVLINLYLDIGNAMLPRLNGIFAFALWDSRNGALIIARDGLGVKPLYYAEIGNGVVFASEIKAMLRLAPMTQELDFDALHRYMSFLWCPGEGTPLKAVRKLGPGEAMLVRNGRVERRWAWYRLPALNGALDKRDRRSAVAGAREYLRRAVHRQMVADVPVGAFLSGGLDSSAVVTFAKEINPEIRCFTIEVDDSQENGATDDLPYAKRVAEHLGVPLDVVSINANRMADDLETMVKHLDEPLADPASLNVLYICQLARKHGIKVLLSGAGGDDIFSGYRRHHALYLERYWNWLPKGARIGLDKAISRLDMRQTWARKLAKLINGASLEGDERIANYFCWAREKDLYNLYSPEVREILNGTTAVKPLLDLLSQAPVTLEPLEKMLLLEQRFFLTDHNLTYTDKMSMAVGVEVRVPFLDMELVEFAASIPSQYKQHGNVGKWALKKAMEPYLPRDVINRPKTGFGAPLRRWIQHDLHELQNDLLSPTSLRRRGVFDPTAVQALIADNARGRIDASYILLSIMCIEIWCRAFIDGK
jgi:asparagine synthase (glutamine-hydrolysing)